jgi:SNF2 family DNA or RNA helicase
VAVAGLDDEKIILTCTYAQRDLVMCIPGSRWNKDEQLWHMPLTWAACLQLRGLFGDGLQLTPELTEWAWDVKRTRIDPALELRELMELPEADAADVVFHVKQWIDKIEADGGLRLKPFQQADVAFNVVCGQAILGSQPGTGKTAVTIRTLQVLQRMGLDPYPALVICPNSLKNTVWGAELAAWAPELSVSVVGGTATARRKQIEELADVTVINYESLRLHTREAGYGTIRLTDKQKARKELNDAGYRTVICDEAHKIRHSDTAMTRSAWAVLHDAEFRFLLTGTPVNDHVGDLWGLLHGIQPDWHPRYTRYVSRYALVGYNWFGGTDILGLQPENAAEFRSITEPAFRRMLKAAVLPQLPPKLPPSIRETPMSPKQAKAYRAMEENLLAVLDDGEILSAPSALAQMTRLLQFSSAMAEIDEKGEVRLKDPSSKVDDLIELLDEMDEDEPLVVAAVSRQLIELAAKRLAEKKIRHGQVTGAFSTVERAKAVSDFQDGRSRVILLTLGAGAEGLTLTRASTMLFMQRSWSPLQNEQATDRIHRIGSEIHDAVRIIHQVTPGTIESRVQELLDVKAWRIEDVLQDAAATRRLLAGVE